MSRAPNNPPPPDEYDFAPMEVEPVRPQTVYSPPDEYPPYADGGIGYGSVSTVLRPGGLTAIGILSIVVGALSLMSSGAFGLWEYGMVLVSRAPRTLVTMPAPAPPPAAVSPPITAAPSPTVNSSALTPAQEAAVLGRLSAGRPNNAQRQTFLSLLRQNGQMIVIPTLGGQPVENQVKSVQRLGDGSISIRAQGPGSFAFITIDSAGNIVQNTVWANNGVSMAASPSSFPRTTPMASRRITPFGGRKLDPTPAVFAAIMSAINGMLAVFLIVAGIFVLRNHVLGRKMHVIYAGLKIVASLAAVVATYWLWTEFLSVVSAPAPNPSASAIAVFLLTIPPMIGLIYPIVVICVMESRGVRAWYAGG